MSALLNGLWYQVPSSVAYRLLRFPLEPLSWLYRVGLRMKESKLEQVRTSKPVISVGNLTVGGNGKTPMVIELIERLHRTGKRSVVVSRGYGRKSRGVLIATENGGRSLSVSQAGDEPIFIAHRGRPAAVIVGEDRVLAVQRALDAVDPDVIICDDAFQHRRLHRDFDVLVIHAQRGFGNRKLLPAGPLREPVSALNRVDLVVFTYANGQKADHLRVLHGVPQSIPALACDMEIDGFSSGSNLEPVENPNQMPVLAVCGIADPSGFYSTCQKAGLLLAGQMSFSDHRFFRASDIKRIERRAKQCKAQAVVVTEKDLVRLPDKALSLPVYGLRIAVRWQEGASGVLDAMLSEVIEKASMSCGVC